MKRIYIALAAACFTSTAFAQSAIDAYRFSQPDLKGTARFMSMGGAFGALGGDLSTLSQNPAGLGIYRWNELGITFDLSTTQGASQSQGMKSYDRKTNFIANNVGLVCALETPWEMMQYLNFGFTYNKKANYSRRYSGNLGALQTSMSNYIAGIANSAGLTVGDVESTTNFDPYNPNDGGIAAPWLTILGYDSYLINPNGDVNNPNWTGQFGNGTTGTAIYDVLERGSVDEYNIAFAGNVGDVVYWGMNFDIVNLDYRLNTYYGESLQNAYVLNKQTDQVDKTTSQWGMTNEYNATGKGMNYQLGVILKPIQELRLGFAFHTPTFYNITEGFRAQTNMNYYGEKGQAITNNGTWADYAYSMQTPWTLMASAAGVFGSKFILSADYEWAKYNGMKFSEDDYEFLNNYDDPFDYYYSSNERGVNNDPYYETNQDIKAIYRPTSTIRVGAEYRVTPKISLRAGYSHVSSPVNVEASDNSMSIYTAGTIPNYRFDRDTNYLTAGVGYRNKGFYVDLAYVNKRMDSEYHAFTPDPGSDFASPQAKVSFNNSQVVVSTGIRF